MDRPRRLRLNGAMTQTTATPHHDRDLSRDPVSIVRSSNFAQNFTEDAFHAPVMAGELALPVGGVPDPVVDVDDVVDVVVATLTRTTGSVR